MINRRAMALLVVTVLTMLIALGAYRYSFTMQAQYRVTRIHEEQIQARLAALSGLELAATILEGSLSERDSLGGVTNNPAVFQHVSIGEDRSASPTNPQSNSAVAHWHVSLISPRTTQDQDGDSEGGEAFSTSRSIAADNSGSSGRATGSLAFGLENESAKLNVPTLLQWERQFPGHARAALLRFPQAEERAVDDWLLEQGVSATGGMAGESRLIDRIQASGSSQSRQSSRDWFHWQWLGGDLNQNYQLDALEAKLAESLRDDSSGLGAETLQHNDATALRRGNVAGWQRYLTWHGGERNENSGGRPRVYLNGDNLADLHQRLAEIWPTQLADFVIAVRQYGPGESDAVTNAGAVSDVASATWTPDFSQPATYRLSSVLDLIDMRVSVPVVADLSPASGLIGANSASSTQVAKVGQGTEKKRWLSSPFSSKISVISDYNERLLDDATVENAFSRVGRVDIRHAPLEVLAGVPGVDVLLAEQIVQQRTSEKSSPLSSFADLSLGAERRSILWLLSEGLVDLSRLKQLEPYLTNRSDVYQVQAVGYRDASSPVYRCTAVIDARQGSAEIIEHQTWHAWDRGFPMEYFAPSPQ